MAKSFDHSAVIGSTWLSAEDHDMENLSFTLQLNDKEVQQGNSRDMIFSIPEIIHYVSQFMTLKTGDLLFTGTPSGVGPVKIGDKLIGSIGGTQIYNFSIR